MGGGGGGGGGGVTCHFVFSWDFFSFMGFFMTYNPFGNLVTYQLCPQDRCKLIRSDLGQIKREVQLLKTKALVYVFFDIFQYSFKLFFILLH